MILTGDWIEQLKTLPSESVQCCVTSPPYWGLRDYKHPKQLGNEKTPQEYVSKLVAGFEEVRRVLKKDGTLWLNLGDSYARQAGDDSKKQTDNGFGGNGSGRTGKSSLLFKTGNNVPPAGTKAKDLVGIPWLVAFALRDAGWYLRCDIIWHKPNPMPESVTDRPTRAHEYIFLLSKSRKYFYDYEAIKEPAKDSSIARLQQPGFDEQQGGEKDPLNGNRSHRKTLTNWKRAVFGGAHKANGYGNRKASGREDEGNYVANGVNKRSVWTIPPANFREAHFATFPPDLIKPCILAGSKPGDTVLDPFFGSGTTGMVATELGREYIGIELNPDYVEMAKRRCCVTKGLPL